MKLTRDEVLMTQHALSEEEIQTYVKRCAPETRSAFEGWLRGERHLDGEALSKGADLSPGLQLSEEPLRKSDDD